MTDTKNTTKRGSQPVSLPVQATQQESGILRNMTVADFKQELGLSKLQVIEGPNGKFLSNGVKSVGTVAKEYDPTAEKQIIEIKGDDGQNVFILCNVGNNDDYTVEETL